MNPLQPLPASRPRRPWMRALLAAVWTVWSAVAGAQRAPLPDALLRDAWRALPVIQALRAASADPREQMALDQRLAVLHAELGEPSSAQRVMPMGPVVQPVDGAVQVLGDVLPRLLGEAAGRRLVMVNEAHHRPQSRLLTIALLPGLYRAGYRYLALEALAEADATGLNRRGYAEAQSGTYMREPVYGELVREALRLGYTVVPYEARGATTPAAREEAQARQLVAHTFARDPAARVLVHAGYAHVFEASGMLFDARPLALQLHTLSGHDPLTIDQTLAHADPRGRAHPRYAEWLGQCARPPCLLAGADGSALALPQRMTDWLLLSADPGSSERPEWLDLGGLRRAVASPAAGLCGGALPCLVEARLARESAGAVPVDRCVVRAEGDCPVLWLRAGADYRLTARGPGGAALRELRLRVAQSAVAVGART